MIIRITVPWDLNRTNPNRQHTIWQVKARTDKAAKECAHLAWVNAGAPVAASPVRVSVVVRRGRSLDQGNIWAACKHLIDGIFVRAMTPDDSERWLTLGTVTQEAGKAWKGREEVVFVVETLEAPEGPQETPRPLQTRRAPVSTPGGHASEREN